MDAFGLNNHGDVVGGAQDGFYQAYTRHADGSYEALGGLGGNRSTAVAISDNGTIAGQGRTGSTGATSTPFVRYGDAPLMPVALPAGGGNAIVSGVTDAGVVAGQFTQPQAQFLAIVGFRWSAANGLETLTPVLPNQGFEVAGVNASGTVVGSTLEEDRRAFRWNTDGSVDWLADSTAFDSAAASDINDAGLIAGNVESVVGNKLVGSLAIWGDDAQLYRTATMDGWDFYAAQAINNGGDVVGYAARPIPYPDGSYLGDESIALLWRDGEAPIDLNTLIDLPGLKLQNAFDINDHGQIIANGFVDGVRFDVLLTPDSGGVPEPASWAMMIAGFALAGAAARSRRRTPCACS